MPPDLAAYSKALATELTLEWLLVIRPVLSHLVGLQTLGVLALDTARGADPGPRVVILVVTVVAVGALGNQREIRYEMLLGKAHVSYLATRVPFWGVEGTAETDAIAQGRPNSSGTGTSFSASKLLLIPQP
jgi:hypothetical protein